MPMHPSVDPDIKRAAIEPVQKDAALNPATKAGGETVAPTGVLRPSNTSPRRR